MAAVFGWSLKVPLASKKRGANWPNPLSKSEAANLGRQEIVHQCCMRIGWTISESNVRGRLRKLWHTEIRRDFWRL